MTIQVTTDMPTWEGFLRPVLVALEDGEQHPAREVGSSAADILGLTPEQRLETLNSGLARYRDRAGWAMSALGRAGAVDRPKRGTYVLNDLGRAMLAEFPQGFGERELVERSPGTGSPPAPVGPTQPPGPTTSGPETLNPREQIAAGVERLHATVATDLLRRLRDVDPTFFEQVDLDLLIAMGYGGSEQRVRRIGGSGDGGVDGVVDQDALGLARIYVQAKRYAEGNVVGRPTIQGFVGALHGQQATQGVFLTTSSFSKEARDYARLVNAAVVLIDGQRLTDLMIQYRVGVQVEQTYAVVKPDDDYFDL